MLSLINYIVETRSNRDCKFSVIIKSVYVINEISMILQLLLILTDQSITGDIIIILKFI